MQRIGEIADHTVYRQIRELGAELFGGTAQCRDRDILRYIGLQRPLRQHGRQQQAGLRRRTRSQFDQHLGLCDAGYITDHMRQQRAFGAGRVVLGQVGDGLEQFAAPRIVEPFGRQALRRRGESGQRIRAQGGGEIVVGEIDFQRRFDHERALSDSSGPAEGMRGEASSGVTTTWPGRTVSTCPSEMGCQRGSLS